MQFRIGDFVTINRHGLGYTVTKPGSKGRIVSISGEEIFVSFSEYANNKDRFPLKSYYIHSTNLDLLKRASSFIVDDALNEPGVEDV